MQKRILAALTLLALAASGFAAPSISVNFCVGLNDTNSVDAGEVATQFRSVDGTNWNNILLSNTKGSSPGVFITNSTGGNFIQLRDDLGRTNAAQLTSTIGSGGGFCNVSSVTPVPALTNSGEAGLMQSYLLIGGNFPAETLAVSGLDSAFTTNGYKVYLFFDIGTVLPTTARTLGYGINDGNSSNVFWAVDSGGDNSDTNDDGVMEWLPAAGGNQASATVGANYAVFTGLRGSNFTVSVTGSARGAINGLQIVANAGAPPVITIFTATPEIISPGATATLAWQVTGADSITITPGIGAVSASGTTNVTPLADTTYTLTASNMFSTATATVTVNKGPVDVYLLGGQSNMLGAGDTNGIPAGQETIAGVLFYNAGVLRTNVVAVASTFGPEIGFANRLKQLRPGAALALIKYAVGGTSLVWDWRPGTNATDTANWGPQFSGFVSAVTNGLAALRAAGYQPRIVGMLWQQGEADAKDGWEYSNTPPTPIANETNAAALYPSNLVHFITRVREQFAADIASAGMRFVAGTVLPYAPPGGDVVARFPARQIINTALLNADENSGSPLAVTNTSTVYCDENITPTNEQIQDGFRDTDEVHLAAPGQLTLGQLMAEHMQAPDYSSWAASHSLTNGPAGDADGDGFADGLEFFLGTNPHSPDSKTAGPVPSLALLDTGSGPTNCFVLTFRQNMVRHAAGVSWQVQGSSDLVNWTNVSLAPVFVDRTDNGDGTATFRYRTATPVDASALGFLRLCLHFAD